MDLKINQELLTLLHEWPHYIEFFINQRSQNVLTKLHSRWIHYIWDGKEDRCLQAARNTYKTTSVLFYGTIWWLLFHPEHRIALIKKAQTDAANIVSAIKQAFKLPAIRELFKFAHGEYPEFRTEREGFLDFTFKKTITPEPSITALGINTTITGEHYDKIICDDFVTSNDRLSKAERERTKFHIREIRTNIANRGMSCGFVGTPWHKDDAWSILPDALKFDVYQCKVFTPEEIEEKRSKTTPSLFAANYLLKLIPDGGKLFTDPVYETWDYKLTYCFGHVDAAFGGSHTNGLTFFNVNKITGKIYGIGKTYLGHVKDWLDVIKAEYARLKCRGIYVETNADKGYTKDLLTAKGLTVFSYHEHMNKDNKISTYLYQEWKNIVWDKTYTDAEYLLQILDYMKNQEPDDCPDSASSLIRAKFYNLKKVKVRKVKGIRI